MCCIWSSCSSCSWCSSWSWGGIVFIMFISNLLFSSKCIPISCSLLQTFIFNTDHWFNISPSSYFWLLCVVWSWGTPEKGHLLYLEFFWKYNKVQVNSVCICMYVHITCMYVCMFMYMLTTVYVIYFLLFLAVRVFPIQNLQFHWEGSKRGLRLLFLV